MRTLKFVILLASVIFMVRLVRNPTLVLAGFLFVRVLYGIYLLCLPPGKLAGRANLSFKSSEIRHLSDNSSASLDAANRIRNDFWYNPSFGSMGDNIYHRDS